MNQPAKTSAPSPSAPAPGFATRDHTISLGPIEVYAEETGIGSLALVFIHYWGGSRRTWSEVIAELAGRCRCVAVDLRGWGKSDRHADDYSLTAQADDVQGLIEELKLKDYVLIGHSMGGKIAQILAGRRPAGLHAVVLVAPAPPTPLGYSDEQKEAMLASYTMPERIGDVLKILSHRPLTFAQRLQVGQDTIGGTECAKAAWLNQGMDLDISRQAAAINVPVCVLVGSSDKVETETGLRAAILPLVPQAQFIIIDGVGHLSPLEAPSELAMAIADFLALPA